MMVTDASVWVSSFHADVHNQATLTWLLTYTASEGQLIAPNLLLAEVAGAIARQTGRTRLGDRALSRLRTYTFLHLVPLEDRLALTSAELAIECRLRGADAVYAALAYLLDLPLLTWDQEQIARVQNVVKAGTPGTLFGNNGLGESQGNTPNDPIGQ